MGILLLLVGLLGAVSGGMKLRERVRSRVESSMLATAEFAAGALAVIGAGVGLARLRPLAWTLVAGVMALVLVSSLSHVRSALRQRKKREDSEAERLRSYLRSQRPTE